MPQRPRLFDREAFEQSLREQGCPESLIGPNASVARYCGVGNISGVELNNDQVLAMWFANQALHLDGRNLTAMSVKEAWAFFSGLPLTRQEEDIVRRIMKEIVGRASAGERTHSPGAK